MTELTSPPLLKEPNTATEPSTSRVIWTLAITALAGLGYARFFEGTYFAQDDFIWLCFSKFHPRPVEVFWTDSLCGQFYRPVGQLWWVAVYRFFGDRLVAYQIGFLSVHFLNTFIVSRLIDRLAGPRVALLSFPFFLINPLFVARISPYYCFVFDTVGFLFFVSSLWLTLAGVERHRWWLSGLALIAATGAYFSKEAYYTLPGALVLVCGITADHDWNWQNLRRFSAWLVAHAGVWVAALAWRRSLIGGLGGYGLAEIQSFEDLIGHLAERATALVSLFGWSLWPGLARNLVSETQPALLSFVVVSALSIWCWRVQTRPRVIWVWAWILVTWSPSLLMTTYAPVSFYAPLLGSSVLAGGLLAHYRRGRGIALGIIACFSISSFWYYSERTSIVQELELQQRKLLEAFGQGRLVQTGDRIMLLRGNLDLMPDPIVKYATPTNEPVPDVLFVNTQSLVGWVICNNSGIGRISPMVVSPDYQSGEMGIGPVKAVPLAFRAQWWDIVQTGPPFRFFKWTGSDWQQIQPPRKTDP